MAIDTATKRYSILNFRSPLIKPLFVPTGSIGDDSRSHLLNLYGGISIAREAPTGLKATTISTVTPYSVNLSWDEHTNVDTDYYSIYINGVWDSDTAPGINLAVVSATSISDLFSVSMVDTSVIESNVSEQVGITLPAKRAQFRHGSGKSRRIN